MFLKRSFSPRGEPAEEEFQLKDVALNREGAALPLSLDNVIFQVFPGDVLCIDEVGELEEWIGAPEFRSDSLLFELLEVKPSDVALEVLAVDDIKRFHLVKFIHCSITPPGAGIRVYSAK